MPELGLFTSLRKQPYNAITSTLQQQAIDAPNEETRRIEDDVAPRAKRLFSSIMRGNAEVQGQANAKRVANQQADNASNASLAWNKDGTVTIKNAPPDLLMKLNDGTEEVENAAAAPKIAVEAALSANPSMTSAAPDAGAAPDDPYAVVDKHIGYRVPRPSDPDIAEKLKTPDGVRQLTLEMGGTKEHAAEVLRRLRRGDTTPDQMRERIAAFRAQRLRAMYDTVKAPVDEAQQERRMSAESLREARRDHEMFLANNLADLGTEDDAVTAGRERAEAAGRSFTPSMEKEIRSAYKGQVRTRDTTVTKTVRSRITGMKEEDIRGYGGDFNQWAANQQAELGEFTPEQLRDAKARFDGIRSEVKAKEAKAEKEAMVEHAREARRMQIDLRSIEATERAARTEERAEAREGRAMRGEEHARAKEQKVERQRVVDEHLKTIKSYNEEIVKNSRDYLKAFKPEEKRWLQRRNQQLNEQIRTLKGQLGELGIQFVQPKQKDGEAAKPTAAAPPAPAGPRTGRHTAVNEQTGQTIVSDDGRTWYDAKTGARLQ